MSSQVLDFDFEFSRQRLEQLLKALREVTVLIECVHQQCDQDPVALLDALQELGTVVAFFSAAPFGRESAGVWIRAAHAGAPVKSISQMS